MSIGIVVLGLITTASTAEGGLESLSAAGEGSYGIFVALGLVMLLASLYLLSAVSTESVEWERIRMGVKAATVPLFVTFVVIVVRRSLMVL